MRIRSHILIFLGFALLLQACSRQPQSLSIAAAANTQYLMEDLITQFRNETGIEVSLSTASSGQLTAQIINGAPFDFFLSADMRYPDSLKAKNMVEEGPRPYAIGKLILWTMKDISLEDEISALTRTDVTKIGIPQPDLAPYGRAAKEALEKLGFYPYVKDKFVYGESVAQVNQYITSGNVDIGFTALSSVRSGPMKGKGNFKEVNRSLFSPIVQGAVMLKTKDAEKADARQKFWNFLQGQTAREIIEHHGYSSPDDKFLSVPK